MPLERLVLIIVIVLAAAGGTVWLGLMFATTMQISPAVTMLLGVPAILGLYILWRVVAERLQNSEDDHYDKIEK